MDSEQEELEALREWWKENGKVVVTGLVLGLGGVFGWTVWQSRVETQAEQASRIYEQMVDMAVQGDHQEADLRADTLINEYPDSGYATFAALIGAKSALAGGQPEEAKRLLRWAVEREDRQELVDVARIRLARILLDENDADGSLALLEEVGAPAFTATIEELRGDVHMVKGDVEAARQAYAKALVIAQISSGSRTRVQMKLDDLGHTEVKGTAP